MHAYFYLRVNFHTQVLDFVISFNYAHSFRCSCVFQNRIFPIPIAYLVGIRDFQAKSGES